jgi:signal transduction histidine kinase
VVVDVIPIANMNERCFLILFEEAALLKTTAAALSIQDITALKDAQLAANQSREALARRTDELQAALGELQHFSYTLSHDMRAPLRAMIGFGELVLAEEKALSATGQIYVKRIADAAERMDKLITDALNYAKLSQQQFETKPVDPGILLRGMIETYPHYQAPASKISIAENMPAVLANEAALTQCFSNLLDNAIKFVSPGKTPEVRIWAEDKGEHVRFWVEDNGIGIAPEYKEKIFEMFQRLDTKYPGTGIGLALVRKAMLRMNGSIGLESEPGKGSRFWLEFRKGV